MSNIDGSPRSENGESAGVIKASGVRGAELGLEENMSVYVCQATGCEIYLGTFEQRVRPGAIGNAEGVLGEGVQNSTGIVEEFESLVTGVDDGCGDLQVLQPIDVDIGGRSLDRQAGGSRDGNCRGDEGDEGSAEGRGEHCVKGSEDS